MASDYSTESKGAKGRRKKADPAPMMPLGFADKVPPHSVDAEKAVLGSIMLDRRAINRATEILQPEAFYLESHKIMFETMQRMTERSATIDVVSLQEELRRLSMLDAVGGTMALVEIAGFVPTSSNIDEYARIVQEHHLKRELIGAAMQILSSSYDPASDALEEVDRAESAIFSIAERRLQKSYVDMKKLANDTMALIMAMSERENKSGTIGVPSGFVQLDKMLGGLQKSDLVIVAARPSMGKTAFALSLARNVAVDARVPVAVFSIEMAAVQLLIRLLSAESRINAHDIRTGRVQENMLPKLVENIARLSDSPMFIDDSPSLSVMELRAKCRRLKAEHDIGLVIVDYLQFMHAPKAESREREISIISRSLKQLAKELDIPVMALAQLNRSVESRGDKRPMLSDLRESGSIEQDADVVMFVHRPEYYGITTFDDDGTDTANKAEIIIGKQRNGPVGTVRLAYMKDFARFENLNQDFDAAPDFSRSNEMDEPF